jgi:hypothetical protein
MNCAHRICGQTKLTIREYHFKLKQSAFPQSLGLSGNAAVPTLEVKGTLGGPLWFRIKSERVVASPLLAGIVERKMISKGHS